MLLFACAPIDSAALTGTPTTTMAALGTVSAQIANCQFVANSIAAQALASTSNFAPIANPTLTGSITLNGALILKGAQLDLAYAVAPATSTVVIGPTTHVQIIQAPTITLGTPLAIIFPPPVDGLRFLCTALGSLPIKCSSTAAIPSAPTSMSSGASFEYMYVSSIGWIRLR